MDDFDPAYVALGSNQGDSRCVIEEAMDRLEAWSGAPLRRSTLWRTRPVDCPAGSPDFINAVVALQPPPGTTPPSLLARLLDLERRFGPRPRKVPNEPRSLDLDLIAWGDRQIQSSDLQLPHPRAHRRRFVLGPLAELAPDLVLPGQDRTVRELLQALD